VYCQGGGCPKHVVYTVSGHVLTFFGMPIIYFPPSKFIRTIRNPVEFDNPHTLKPIEKLHEAFNINIVLVEIHLVLMRCLLAFKIDTQIKPRI